MNVPDNYDLWEAHDRNQAERLKKLPTCDRCGDAIQQEMAVRIYGNWFCDECIKECREEVDVE